MTSDARAGLVSAIEQVLPGATWQRRVARLARETERGTGAGRVLPSRASPVRLVGAVLPGADEAWRERRWFDGQSVPGAHGEPREGAVGADDELKREAAEVIELALTGTVVSRRRAA